MARPLFTHPRSRAWASALGSLVTSVLVTAAAPLYLPFSQTDSIGIPILLFPVTWLALFLYSALAARVDVVWLVLAGLGLSHAALIYLAIAPQAT